MKKGFNCANNNNNNNNGEEINFLSLTKCPIPFSSYKKSVVQCHSCNPSKLLDF